MMVRMTKPQIGERLNDPAAGTFGFMVAANDYLSDQTDEFFDLSQADRKFEKEEAFSGMELVPNTHRLALMNQYLHGMDGRLDQGDSLSAAGKWMKNFDVILTNPHAVGGCLVARCMVRREVSVLCGHRWGS